MSKIVIYIHGKGGTAQEAEHYQALFPEADVVGFDYEAETPWEAVQEFPAFYDKAVAGYQTVYVFANSIGAFFTLCALSEKHIDKVFFISPIVDMEKLILQMMAWAKVTEAELQERKEIPTEFGETLSWDYLCYVREHPPKWQHPVYILYGEKDNLMSRENIADFVEKVGGELTVMKNGEHWFHSDEQMAFLDNWIKSIG